MFRPSCRPSSGSTNYLNIRQDYTFTGAKYSIEYRLSVNNEIPFTVPVHSVNEIILLTAMYPLSHR